MTNTELQEIKNILTIKRFNIGVYQIKIGKKCMMFQLTGNDEKKILRLKEILENGK